MEEKRVVAEADPENHQGDGCLSMGRRSWSKNNSRSLFYSLKLFFLISAEEKYIGRGRRSPVRRAAGSASG